MTDLEIKTLLRKLHALTGRLSADLLALGVATPDRSHLPSIFAIQKKLFECQSLADMIVKASEDEYFRAFV